MYKVYYDPKGEGVVEKDGESFGTKRKDSTTVILVEEDYKKKIEILNAEIQALNDTVRTF